MGNEPIVSHASLIPIAALLLSSSRPALDQGQLPKDGGCPYSYRSSSDYCIPARTPRMPSSAPVTPAPMGIGSQAKTAPPIRPSRREFITKQGFRSISIVIKNLVVGFAAAGSLGCCLPATQAHLRQLSEDSETNHPFGGRKSSGVPMTLIAELHQPMTSTIKNFVRSSFSEGITKLGISILQTAKQPERIERSGRYLGIAFNTKLQKEAIARILATLKAQ